MATSASSTALLAAVVATAGRQAHRMIADIDAEHHDEQGDGRQRSGIVRKVIAKIVHAGTFAV